MINKRMEDAINNQINAEYYSGYLYLSMAAYFEDLNLSGFSNWMKIQYQEEISHVMKFFNYLNERGGRVLLKGIDAPTTAWNSTADVIRATLKHEQDVTAMINNLMDIALEEKDHATTNFLQWYVEEQVEEEANVSSILAKLEMANESKAGLLFLDQEMSKRVFVDSTVSK